MATLHDLSEPELEEAIGEGDLRGVQLLQAAFTAGVVLFALVTLLLVLVLESGPPAGEVPPPQGGGLITLLSLIHLALALGSWSLVGVLFNMSFRVNLATLRRQAPQSDSPISVDHAVSALRAAWILRLAMLEGPALFGVVICLVAGLNGEIQAQPLYWLNLLNPLLFVLFSLATFPTRPRLAESIRSRLEDEA